MESGKASHVTRENPRSSDRGSNKGTDPELGMDSRCLSRRKQEVGRCGWTQ